MKRKILCLFFLILTVNSVAFACDMSSYLRILAQKKRKRERLPEKLDNNDLLILHSEGLSMSLESLVHSFSRKYKSNRVFLQSTSLPNATTALKLTTEAPDIVAFSSTDSMSKLMPLHVDWYVNFAIDEMVLVHGGESKHFDFLKSATWQEVVTSPKLKYGRVDPLEDCAGLRSLQIQSFTDEFLYGKTGGKVRWDQSLTMLNNSTKLVRAIIDLKVDFGFMYQSEARYQRMFIKKLPDLYKETKVKPIVYAFSILKSSTHREAARKFADFLLSRSGLALVRSGGLKTIKGGQIVFSKTPSFH